MTGAKRHKRSGTSGVNTAEIRQHNPLRNTNIKLIMSSVLMVACDTL